MLLINYFIFLLLFVVILRPFSTLVHELGHGIPALLFTNKKVTLYLGSYGNPKDSFKFVIGRLELFLHKKPLHWKIGLCAFEQHTLSINKLLFIYVMGPLTSLGLSIILSYIVFFGELSENVKFIVFFFNVTTYYEFYRDIVPHNEPIELHDGTKIFNDGKQIVELLKCHKRL